MLFVTVIVFLDLNILYSEKTETGIIDNFLKDSFCYDSTGI